MVVVVVGSTNPVKINAVKQAFTRCNIAVTSVTGVSGVKSGVNNQPIGWEETERGAKNRARSSLTKSIENPDFSVGIEGGLVTSSNGQGLDCIAVMAVLNVRSGTMSTSRTAAFTLPPALCALVRNGMELGDADDVVFKRTNSKQQDGTVGILTNGAIDRTEYYVHALVLALVPELQGRLYGSSAMSVVDLKASWWQRYMFQLRENPIVTKSHTSGVVTALGSVMGQILSGGSISWRKVIAFGLFGEFGTGPIIHFWTSWLAKNGPKNVFMKTLVDRLLFHPPFQYSFLLFVALFQGNVSLDKALQNTNSIIGGVVRKALIFWPPAMYFIFNKLPVHLQPVGSNLTAFVWSCFLGLTT